MNIYQMVQSQISLKGWLLVRWLGLGRSETSKRNFINQDSVVWLLGKGRRSSAGNQSACAKIGQSLARNQSACASSVRVQPGISRPVQNRSEFSQESVGLCKVGQSSAWNQSACANRSKSARNQSVCAKSVRVKPGISRPVQSRSEVCQESIGLCKVSQSSAKNQSACAKSSEFSQESVGRCKVGQSSARNQSVCAKSIRVQSEISRPVQSRSSSCSQESVGLCKVVHLVGISQLRGTNPIVQP
jgi:hypothetical protein